MDHLTVRFKGGGVGITSFSVDQGQYHVGMEQGIEGRAESFDAVLSRGTCTAETSGIAFVTRGNVVVLHNIVMGRKRICGVFH
eukprot:scaffold9944_cov52-Cyclotella_meneghiniana.AAC.3